MKYRQSLALVAVLVLVCLPGAVRGETTPQAQNWSWDVEPVDASAGYGQSLALDSSGYPHIAAAGGGIRYERRTAGGWLAPELVESGDYGEAALALDGDDYPHISYQDRSFEGNGLKYAYKDAGGWHVEYADAKLRSALMLGFNSSIALGTDGYPRIAYLYDKLAAIQLKFAYKDASGWHTATLSTFGLTGTGPTSLALDADDYAHILTYRGTGYIDLVYVYQDATGWHLEHIADCGQSSQLRLDQDDQPHIVYNNCESTLVYAYKDGTGWHHQLVAPGSAPSLALDGNDEPHIACIGENNKRLELITRNGTTWTKFLADEALVQLLGPSLAIGTDGHAHIAYTYRPDTFDQDLYYARGEPQQGPCTSELAIATFEDRDGDGAQDAGEPLLPWSYSLTVNGDSSTVQSPAGETYRTTLTEGDAWTVVATPDVRWVPTTPDTLSGTAACAAQQALFGVQPSKLIYVPLLIKQ